MNMALRHAALHERNIDFHMVAEILSYVFLMGAMLPFIY